MKGRRIVLDHLDNREAAALMVDGTLHDLLIDGDAPRPGTVYRAVADRPVKGQGGMFLKTPDGAAFLRQVRGLSPGRPLLAQVSGYAESGKAIPVTQKLLFKSRYAIITPGAPGLNISRAIRDESLRDHLLELAHDIMGEATDGLILRSCAAHADAFDIEEDIQAMKALARKVLDDDSRDMVKLVEGDGPHVLAWRDWAAPADVVMQDGSFGAEGVLA
ncbi:MAG: ribonuclease E/G, partial [Pseudomonadota bacterium]